MCISSDAVMCLCSSSLPQKDLINEYCVTVKTQKETRATLMTRNKVKTDTLNKLMSKSKKKVLKAGFEYSKAALA